MSPVCEDEHRVFRAIGTVLGGMLLAFVVSVSALLHGCGPSSVVTVSDEPPGDVIRTARGTLVAFPAFLLRWPELEARALKEIDAANPPAGYSVVVHVPVFFQRDWGINVRGWVDLNMRVIHVGWRLADYEDGPGRPLLPALAYECANAHAGHETGPLPAWLTREKQ